LLRYSRHAFANARVFKGIRNIAAYFLLGCAVALASYGGTTTYVYDVHGRLKAVIVPNGSDQTITNQTLDNASNRTSVISFLGSTPPSTPTGVTATVLASDKIRLNWAPSLDAGGGPVLYYRVYRGGQLVASPSVPPFDDWPLTHATTYSYRVSAVDAATHESAQSSPAVNATTPTDTTVPSTPANLSGGAVSGTQVNLSWNASTDTGGSGLVGYEIFRNNGIISSSAPPSFSDLTANHGTNYTYKVRAYDGAGNRSGFSNEISVTTPDTAAPSAPGNPTFSSITLDSAVANWSPATDNIGVTGYRYTLNGGGSWTTLGNVTSTTLSGLQFATNYTMLLQARDAAGNWGPLSSGSFTTSSSYITIAIGAAPPVVQPGHESTYWCWYEIDWYYFIEYAYCDVTGLGNVMYHSYYPPQAPYVATGYTWDGMYLAVESNYYGTY
jgi:chitodextrinase